MTHSISEQIKAINRARKESRLGLESLAQHNAHDQALNDAANTLAAIKMLFSGGEEKIRAEFVKFSLDPSREPFTGADDFIDFLRSRGLDLNNIK